jgi:hypothetical protein
MYLTKRKEKIEPENVCQAGAKYALNTSSVFSVPPK